MGAIRDIGINEFDELVLNSDVPVLVDFSQLHCLPCKRVMPALEEAIDRIGDKGRIYKVMFEDDPQLVFKYDVTSFPTMILFKGGQVAKRLIGPRQTDVIVELFE